MYYLINKLGQNPSIAIRSLELSCKTVLCVLYFFTVLSFDCKEINNFS